MKRKTLTATGVRRATPPTDPRRRRMDWDAVVPGLALQQPAGSRVGVDRGITAPGLGASWRPPASAVDRAASRHL